MESRPEDWKQLSLEELMDKKVTIETEMLTHNTTLETQGGVGMQGSLVDSEGFPRADIDMYAVRTARNKIICLRNDHKAVMKMIEEKLHVIHADARLRRGEGSGVTGERRENTLPMTFARISQISDGSPSAIAGLKTGDQIAEFGSLTAANFTDVKNVADVVQHSINCAIHVVLIRNGEIISLSLTPQRWQGQGVLGCVIVPS